LPSKINTPDDENEKLNYLIDEYRKENDKCSRKIHELQDKLHQTQNRFNKAQPEPTDTISHYSKNTTRSGTGMTVVGKVFT
jgi:predicted  nucleic acid-binding Zn-ribbon protein